MSAHDDDPTTPASHDFGLLRRLLAYLRPHARAVFVSFLLIVAQAGIDLAGPYLTKVAIDRYIAAASASCRTCAATSSATCSASTSPTSTATRWGG